MQDLARHQDPYDGTVQPIDVAILDAQPSHPDNSTPRVQMPIRSDGDRTVFYRDWAAAAATIAANASSLVPRPSMYAFHVA